MPTTRRTLTLRIAILAFWVVLLLLAVGPVFAQDGSTAEVAPDGLDELAARLAPLLVGAALIERGLEFIFNWVERAVLDCSHYLHAFAARVTGLVTVDLRQAWGEWNDLTSALINENRTAEAAMSGDPDSDDPSEWPLGTLEARLIEAREQLEAGQTALEKAMDSPIYISRKRVAAGWLSMSFGVALAATTGLRLFAPLGIDVPGWFESPFDIVDLVLAGLLMGLGTEWVHQVIGLLIQGKGLLGRAGTGSNLDTEQVRNLAALTVEDEFNARLDQMLPEFLRGVVTAHAASAADDGDTKAISPLASRILAELPATASAAATGSGLPGRSSVVEGAEADQDEDVLPLDDTGDEDDGTLAETDAATTSGTVTAAAQSLASSTAQDAAPALRHIVSMRDTMVTVRRGGAVARREPTSDSQKLGDLRGGEHRWTRALAWGDSTWLQIPWDAPDVKTAWIPAEQTDFPRGTGYTQVSRAWYESDAVLAFRRGLLRDLLRVRGTATDRMDQVSRLNGEALVQLEQSLAGQTMIPEYGNFWRLQALLGLPDAFDLLPVHTSPPALIESLDFVGFGPSSFAFKNWELYYEDARGLHTGVDFILPEGSPLIAVCDGTIESAPAPDLPDAPLVLRPYLPVRYRNDDGSRQLSNVLVIYEHLMGDPTSQIVAPGDEVSAGQIIGTSGWPAYPMGERTVVQRNNPHLHVEVHLVTDGEQSLGTRCPLNPLLFWTPRLIALQARLASHGEGAPYPTQGHAFGRLGFFSVGTFDTDPDLPVFWSHEPSADQPFAEGVYTLEQTVDWLKTFEPYAPAQHQAPAALTDEAGD
ncbi:M23 family metallopeptidase [Aggregatilinea lenta]|uniref:M23 family metallopeptidase n=1 Tax=Aggregatilinea lenta TaxID=913108 RepID=UPI0013C29F20|nr:M23 family metallopeptidase [Aggregatilinea lenta]